MVWAKSKSKREILRGEDAHFKPLEQFKVQDRPIGHVRERVVPKKSRAKEIEAPTEMCQGGRMDHVIACKTSTFPMERGKVDTYLGEK